MKKYCFGIDVGGTTVKCGLFTLDGEIVEKWEIPTRTAENGKNILPDVAAAILMKLTQLQIPKGEVAGIGIGVPGPVDEHGEVPVAVNLHWGRVNIVEEIETSSPRKYLEEYLAGKEVKIEETVMPGGDLIYDVDIAGLRQRFSFTPLD